MVSFERTRDLALVRSIVTHPRVYRGVLSDFAPTPEAYQPPDNESYWYLIPKRLNVPLGVFVFVPQSPVWWEAHMALLPQAWGEAAEISKAMVAWLAQHTSCRKITAHVPQYNRLMIHLAKRIGMTHVGVNTRSVRKNGTLHDQQIFGLEVNS